MWSECLRRMEKDKGRKVSVARIVTHIDNNDLQGKMEKHAKGMVDWSKG